MEGIVKELAELNKRDWLDIIAILVPIVLSMIIIVQNKIYECRNIELQKRIHNREWSQQYHEDILLLYNTYYEFCDTIISSGFSYSVKCGNVNAAILWLNQLRTLKMNILRRKDLAKLLFEKKNIELFNVINKCFENENSILDKYLSYISSGKLLEISENAWNTILPGTLLQRYNYGLLQQNSTVYDNFLKLCKSNELEEIEKLLQNDTDLHSYEQFDKYFEEYFAVDKLA
mgnify:FL=1